MDSEGGFRGALTAQAVAELLAEAPDDAKGARKTAAELAERPHPLTSDMSLGTALHLLVSSSGTGLPVFDTEDGHLVGWLTRQSAQRALHPDSPSGAGPGRHGGEPKR
ncbi:hypothetical protein OG444_31885 [Streptomyces sp. NBC_01232]|uniref:CBS domain-containing protein n=1 Tax=unclassified Streptomyces TaxID=2593676 RepID=UPI00224D5667|nr:MULTISPECIES: CBS domain-containing protein [unclassified Streptomyces]MCX4806949.1 hypothetical protein [Streptomyces sp. NBC_01214]WSQ03690.1 hypothetical protein OG444_31885 [Streptomyces sp. NBC_01232]WSR20380.1 hypothetical protein OG457_09650 [Streptomyces sp. NBC_01207]